MYRIIGADGQEYGPVSAEQLRQWITGGRANAQTSAMAEGATEWKPLASWPEFSSLFASPAAAKTSLAALSISAPVRRNNFFAVAGLTLAVLSLGCCCCCYGLPFNLIALVFSIIGLVQIRSDPQLYHGQGVAIAGLVIAILSILWGLGLLAILGLAESWKEIPSRLHRL